MPEYTQEQIDAMIAEAKKGLFGEDELTRRVTSEVDRRVETGIQKGLETHKSKWEEEFKRKQTLTAEELASQKMKEMQETLTTKEKEINRKANLTDAKDMLASAGVPKSQYEKVVSMLVNEDSESTKANVQSFIETFTSLKTDLETQIKTEFTKVPPPSQGDNKPITKADFDKMGYAEKIKFKQTNPEQYKEFMK